MARTVIVRRRQALIGGTPSTTSWSWSRASSLNPGTVRHAQVEQQAAGRVNRAAAIEVVDSRIGADVPAVRTEQALEAPPHRRVVI